MTLLSQLWRIGRLFGSTFGHAAWVNAVNLPPADKAAVLAAVVGATEAAYRQALPAGKVATVVKDLKAAWDVVQAVKAQNLPIPAPAPVQQTP